MGSSANQRGLGLATWLGAIGAACVALAAAYVYLAQHFSYSDGERAGWVQKLSRKGWLCKTWEGELAMVALPGSVPEKFLFTVPDDAVAAQINAAMGRRVALSYAEHPGLPTTCFGDSRYFVTQVRTVEDSPAAAAPKR